MPPTIKGKLAKHKVDFAAKGPIWSGPNGEGRNGGVTYSLLSRYLSCKERFRILVVDGLKPVERFNPALEFGQMWHVVEESYGKDQAAGMERVFDGPFRDYCLKLWHKYPLDRDDIGHWAEVTQQLFPRYFDHWSQHPDVKSRVVLLPETAFDIILLLPSRRSVRLRGKWDSVDLIGTGQSVDVRLQENKTKSRLDHVKITRQLSFDLQTMTYLVALKQFDWWNTSQNTQVMMKGKRIGGVRYNVVKRSTHKTPTSMMKKVDEDLADNRASEWFDRYNVEVYESDYAVFERTCLVPVLENLLDDWEWWEYCVRTTCDQYDWQQRVRIFPEHRARHYRHPFGVYNVLDEGGASELDHYLLTGSRGGLRVVDTLFPELED